MDFKHRMKDVAILVLGEGIFYSVARSIGIPGALGLTSFISAIVGFPLILFWRSRPSRIVKK